MFQGSCVPLIHLVGIGPGDPELLTARAKSILRDSDVILGYEPYVGSVKRLLPSETVEYRPYEIGQEVQRADDTIELAESGRKVSLISSGDAGIYGMGSPLFERLDQQGHDGVDVNVVPGITALSAAASQLGAPVGQDFAAISLSDLLTAWDQIRKRVRCAAEGDFVLVFYNPRSKNRQDQLDEALTIISRYRDPDTPVGLVWNAYRREQRTEITSLTDVPTGEVNMLSTVIVGNSRTRTSSGWIYTPRGYQQEGTPTG